MYGIGKGGPHGIHLESHKEKALLPRIRPGVRRSTGECKETREIRKKSKIEKMEREKCFPFR